jgi:hypothetical protein
MTSTCHIEAHANNSDRRWKSASLHALPVCLFILGLFYYWFAIADRYAIFLYGHLGATPFDEVTSSRYWMSGLVASGAVMVAYTITNWLLGRVAALRHLGYCPPTWWHVWTLCVIPLAVGILCITMTVNWPTLSPANATPCAVVALIGLALALVPGSLAAQRPSELGWLILDGLGLMPSLLLLRAVELPSRGLLTVGAAYLVAFGSVFAGVVWLGAMSGLHAWRHRPWPGASKVFVAGLCLSYLLMPLVHHLFFTPPKYRYISASSNFFAHSMGVQLMVFFAAAILAVGVTRLSSLR